MIQKLDAMTVSWWFGNTVLLVVSLMVVTAALLLDPSPGAVSLFGVDIPVLCGWRRMTSIPCPGCGLTRSFSFMAHGQVMSAFHVNWFGPPGFAIVVAQVPIRAFKLWRGRPSA